MTRRCLPLSLTAFALIAMLIFFGCGAKETPPPAAVEAPAESAEAEAAMQPESPEAKEEEPAERDEESASEAHRHHPEEEAAMSLPTVPEGSVLHLIPEQTIGLIYCPSLAELDARLNALAQELMPMAEPPELLASILADTFGAGFESLDELEEIGLDLNKDFAIFFTSLEPMFLSATVHLTEPEAIMQVIEMEAEGSAPVEYNGVTYWNAAGGGGSFAILDDVLVFSQQATVCESTIDTFQGKTPAVAMNVNYIRFLTDVVAGTNQLAVRFDFDSIGPLLSVKLEEEVNEMVDSLESASESAGLVPMVAKTLGGALSLIDKAKTLRLTLSVEGADVQIAPSLTFKPGSAMQKMLSGMRGELSLLNGLPERATMSGAIKVSPKTLLALGKLGFMFVPQDTPEQKAVLEPVIERMAGFYEALTGEMASTLNFSDSLIPDSLIVYGVQDAAKARAYMDEGFVEQLQVSMQLMQGMMAGLPNADGVLGMYEGAAPGPSEMHNGVEIKSYTFPNFGKVWAQAEVPLPLPPVWNCYYAFTEAHLFLVMGSSPQLLKDALDGMAGTSTTLATHPSYQHLARKLGTDNHVFYAISPIIAAKSLGPLLIQSDPGNAAALQIFSGMLENLPDNYSIGFAAKAHDSGIDTKLLLTLGDFKQLIQMIAMMSGGSRG